MRVLFSLTIVLLSFNAMSNTDLDLGQRLALLTPGNEQKLTNYQTDLYTERFELAKMSRDISYQSWRDYYLSGDPELFNDALYWSEKFEKAPQIISERPASVHLTRSIPKDYKQGLKNFLNFKILCRCS